MSVTKLVCLSLLVCGLMSAASGQARRVRLRPRPEPIPEDQLQYYEAEPRGGDQDVVLVDDELALYGRQGASRADFNRPAAIKPRTKEAPRAPPVQTIRNYNKVNDDGSFTFGYEAADGSFKEETRGTDCVVRGKYGYVDPDGNKREFSYVSGNPCDPNAASEDEEELENAQEESNEAAGEPANYPSRPTAANYPIRTVRPQPTTSRPATTVFENIYRHNGPEIQEEEEAPRTRAPRPPSTPLAITPRPLPPATTFRPQLLQITQRPHSTPVPHVVYSSVIPTSIGTTPPTYASSTYRPAGHIDFAAEFAKFQQENQIVSSTPATYKTKAKTSEPISPSGNPIYSTQLLFDPSSGQYDSSLFQSLPQNTGDFTLNQRVPRPTPRQPQLPQLLQQQPQGFNPSPLYRHRLQHPAPVQQQQQQQRSPQEVYQRQQAEQQFQNSAQLYAQQQQLQQSQLQQDRQAARAALAPQQQQQSQQPQQFYYVAPGREQQAGPIDAFLRGHGLSVY